MALREDEQTTIMEEWWRMESWREWKEWGECKVTPLPQQREEEESACGVGTWARTDSPATTTTTQQ